LDVVFETGQNDETARSAADDHNFCSGYDVH
jgi:hypothetical protein